MISIVVHGILGTTYCREMVATDDATDADIVLLQDIRRYLSIQYGDSTPINGWAMHPAPSGMWLSRIERAFDINYQPAYVMVSFLIPQGFRMSDESISHINRCMILNHSKYMQQSVIQVKADWGFLHKLKRELESMLIGPSDPVAPAHPAPSGSAAYWPGDIQSMLANMWDQRLRMFNIVFCENRILSGKNDVISVDDVVIDPKVDQREQAVDLQAEPPEIIGPHPDVDTTEDEGTTYENEDAKSNDFVDEPQMPADAEVKIQEQEMSHTSEKETQQQQHPNAGQGKNRNLINNLLVFLAVVAVLFLVFLFENREHFQSQEIDTINYYDYAVVTEEAIEEQCVETISASYDNRINISTTDKLFLCLSWENVKNDGELFDEKYSIQDESLRQRADTIIVYANKIGQKAYSNGYGKASSKSDSFLYLENYVSQKHNLEF